MGGLELGVSQQMRFLVEETAHVLLPTNGNWRCGSSAWAKVAKLLSADKYNLEHLRDEC